LPSNPSRCNSNCSAVYELSPGIGGTWTETVLYSFSGQADGGAPQSDLAIDSAGNIYGTTTILGAADAGTVFAPGG